MGRKNQFTTPTPQTLHNEQRLLGDFRKKEALAYIFLFELPQGDGQESPWRVMNQLCVSYSTMAEVELSHLTTRLKHSTPPADKFFERQHSVFGFMDGADMAV